MFMSLNQHADDDGDNGDDVGDDELDDEPALSVETSSISSDDLSRLWTYEWTLVHSLSPNRELNICNADTQSSSPNHQACRQRSVSLSSERRSEPQRDMTRLDSSPHSENSWMDERRGRDRSRQASESTGDKKQESGYFSPGRRANSEQQIEEVNKRPFHYYERGHPLPSNIIPEPKACVPYRNVNLGVPSQRRNTETYMQEIWRSESPQRYTYHSNFRRGTESQSNSPTRHSSVSPNSQDQYKFTDSPLGTQRRSSISRNKSHASSHCTPSHSPSRQTSGRTSPSRRRGSAVSRVVSPSRISPSNRTTDSFYLQNGEFDAQKVASRASGVLLKHQTNIV
ncbi:serine/arginine repetitive matrix protein 2-like [Thalassophryne amazonica]|uniref:serine/arginine repetitive matrix protein 2-like n=1 Tax=Thalassophryne amazonica TaxID=390379 RepID=UPI001471CCCB|nr:serine/arginine repetitive matrix protein 2-like [Thalassophryne amazonica]